MGSGSGREQKMLSIQNGVLCIPPLNPDRLRRVAASLDAMSEGKAASMLLNCQADASQAQALLDLAWRRLHSCAHWEDVDTAWRAAYMAAALVTAKANWEGFEEGAAGACLRTIDRTHAGA